MTQEIRAFDTGSYFPRWMGLTERHESLAFLFFRLAMYIARSA